MNKVFITNPAYWLAIVALLPAAACSDIGESGETSGYGEECVLPMTLKGMPYRNASGNQTESLEGVSLFHFKGDEYVMRTDIDDPYAEDISIQVGGTTRLYCLSGISLPAETGTTGRKDFDCFVVSSGEGAQSAPLFYSSVADLDASVWNSGRLDVSLLRSVARIDFANIVDQKVTVSKVVVMDAPAETYAFSAGETPSDKSVTYSKVYDTPFQGFEEGLFYIFESDRPVHVRILGEYGDSPLNIEAILPSVERNRIYTLQTVNVNSRVEGAFTVRDWAEGDSVNANTGAESGIFIDKNNSRLPQGVDVDFTTNRVNIPSSGVSGMRLAFLSETKVSVASIEGEVASVAISVNDPVKAGEGYMSSFDVDIAPQPNGASSYSVTVHLRDEAGRYNFVEITVPSLHYIETVNIAGSEWMCFNAVSADPDNQVFPFEGITVEEMYRDYWVQSIGNFFQYGRQPGYNPWTRNDPNGNSGTERDIPWSTPECMPMPEGYHVASAEEWLRLLPVGTTIPSTYTAGNGEEIKAELVILPGTVAGTPSVSANRANLQMRYVRFESLQTGNVLIFPICGQKTASMDEYPGSGRIMHNCVCYWIADDRCVWVLMVNDNDGVLTVSQQKDRWNYDGFLPVRGIKNND